MQIDDKLIEYLEDLSCFTLSDNEKIRLKDDLQKTMNNIAHLADLNTDGTDECCHPFEHANIFRDDEVRPSLDRELVLKNASLKNDEMFIAPKTIE
ncbi:MAG: Asp-tRNA(Asn)/Glu-tRNA(Gln) amidotransferase subunit GatC [Treponema sp.]|nr:Asp-tRNA(Asn)/Glu-tRNA(Gln) amidotransferase subunit GatC [Treponema sp.]